MEKIYIVYTDHYDLPFDSCVEKVFLNKKRAYDYSSANNLEVIEVEVVND